MTNDNFTTSNLTEQSLLDSVIDLTVKTYGINPLFIYDQFTGRPLGRLNESDLEFIVLERAYDLEVEDDRIECAEELMKRTCYAVRPSILTNYLRKDSMTAMLKHRPVELFAYLYNRLNEPVDRHATRRGKLEENHRLLIQSRIAFWHRLSQADEDESFLSRLKACLTPMLGLDVEFSAQAIYCGFMLEFDVEGNPDFDSLQERFSTNLYDRKMGKVFEKAQAKRYASQARGNAASRGAYASSFWDTKPESKAKVKKTAKRTHQLKIRSKISGILAGVLGDVPKLTPKSSTPAKSVSLTSALMAGLNEKKDAEGGES